MRNTWPPWSSLHLWQDKTGSGSLLLDSKKQYAIKHWLEKTSERATEQVMISMRDAPFSFGPWGETFSILGWMFLDSTVDLLAVPDCGLVPAVHEATIALDWSLPMTADSQTYLFTRVRMQFEKSTAIIENPADRRRYRLCEEDLMSLRNLMCLWSQIRAFCSTRLGTFSDFDHAITSGNSKDHELREILEQKPARFSLSMLPCAQKHALEEVRAAEEGATLEAETERLKVREARWQWFQAALARDQVLLRQVVAAPEKSRLWSIASRCHGAWFKPRMVRRWFGATWISSCIARWWRRLSWHSRRSTSTEVLLLLDLDDMFVLNWAEAFDSEIGINSEQVIHHEYETQGIQLRVCWPQLN